jgi:hypothetical protein
MGPEIISGTWRGQRTTTTLIMRPDVDLTNPAELLTMFSLQGFSEFP